MFQVRQYNKAFKLRNILKYALWTILLIVTTLPELSAQNQKQPTFTVYGSVKDDKGVPIMGARIQIQESTRFTTTDEAGEFSVDVPGINTIINIEAVGFKSQSVTITDQKTIDVVLIDSEEGQGIKDRVFMPWAVTDKRSATGSASAITQEELRKSPVMSISNALSGRLPGLTVVSQSGSPGNENEYWRIRGIRTLENGGMNNMAKGGVGAPIAIVDGFERSFSDLDASEIESITVLKDAAATILYGMRGANGVILVTTKRGQENKRTIDVEVSTGIVSPLRLPEFMDSYEYAKFNNEAKFNDGLDKLYSDADLEKYRTNSDPLTHPNTDYYKEFIKPFTTQNKAALTMSGGNKIVRYFVSLAYNNQDGLYNRTDEGTGFDTKTRYSRYNTRTNIDVTISKRLEANISISGRIEDRRYPYETESAIFGVLSGYPSNAFPLSFTGIEPTLKTDIFMLGGNSLYTSNPLGMLSYRGFNEDTRRYYQLGVGFKYDMSFITKGLSFNFDLNADGYNLYNVFKYKTYRVWDRQVQPDLSVIYVPFNTESSLTTDFESTVTSYNGINLNLNYKRTFGLHDVKVFAMMRRFKTLYQQANQSDRKIEDYALRLNYSYNNRYFLEVATDLSGSDNFFLTKKPRILLPAVSAAWIVSDESFLKGSDVLKFLKLRASWGITANDEYSYLDINGYKYRYPYRDRWWTYAGDQYFGTSLTSVTVVREGVLPNNNFTPEKARMINFGIDSKYFNNHLSFSADAWFEKRYDIFSRGIGNLPSALGVLSTNLAIENNGIVFSRGFEIMAGWNSNIGKINYWLNGYVDHSKSTIDYMAEPYKEDPYRVETGGRVRQDFGLIALGLFKNQDDIDNSPVQKFGPYQAGDIKYKDLNGDNVIDANDYTALGLGTFPTLTYSMDMGFRIKQFDFSMLWQGSSQRSFYMDNVAVRAFYLDGNISEYARNRYTDEASWATADYPRLTTLANDNNWRISTFWLKDATFLRLKNLEIGYNLSGPAMKKLGLYGLRVYLNAYNILTLDNLKDFDPEDPSAGISKYPMTSIVNLGLNLKF
jgi:TonB-linked SusC/RagA family outer membrane protein